MLSLVTLISHDSINTRLERTAGIRFGTKIKFNIWFNIEPLQGFARFVHLLDDISKSRRVYLLRYCVRCVICVLIIEILLKRSAKVSDL